MNGPTGAVPDSSLSPLQPPDATQLVTPALDQERVDEPPDATLLGDALNVTVGTGDVTVTVAD